MTEPRADDASIDALVARLADRLLAERGMLATAESCTGGLIAAACTSLAGSSRWFERGFVTYSNEAKIELLGVDADLVARHGAVSEAVAASMARGAVARSRATLAVAVTGIAGPGGGSADKPVGTVWLAVADAASARTRRLNATGDRDAIRAASVRAALAMLLEPPTTG